MLIMDIRTVLSAEDKKKIEGYINYYGNGEKCQDVDRVLTEWASAKEHLYHAFGDNLIIEFPVKYNSPLNDLAAQCQAAFHEPCDGTMDFQDYLYALIDNFTYGVHLSQYWFTANFMSSERLAAGTLDSPTIEDEYLVSKKTGKVFKFHKGEKYFHALGKLVRDAGADEEIFNKFRIKISQITNQKKLNGTMCISIHPLDYMTMSDNDYGWDSCMNWATDEGGDYRMGTVEMMNSPFVVVAYLKGEGKHAKYQWGAQEWQYWNNKKWRELFIIAPEWINEIKSYPYDNKEFTCLVMDKLREVLNDYPDELWFNSSTHFGGDNRAVLSFRTSSNGMYNDMGLSRNPKGHLMYYNKKAMDDLFADRLCYNIHYSGNKTCMACGVFIEDYEAESSQVMCPLCGNYIREHCVCCGCSLGRNDEIYWNRWDEPYCEDCYDQNYTHDDLFDEEIDNANVIEISVIVGEPTRDKLCKSQSYFTSFEQLRNYFGIEPAAYDDGEQTWYYYNLYDIIEADNAKMARKFGFVFDNSEFKARRWYGWEHGENAEQYLSLSQQIAEYTKNGYVNWSVQWAMG